MKQLEASFEREYGIALAKFKAWWNSILLAKESKLRAEDIKKLTDAYQKAVDALNNQFATSWSNNVAAAATEA